MANVTPVHIVIIACIIVGIIVPLHQFKTKCTNVESQFLADKEKHKENIASLHEQCQQQLDEHLTAKQESFQRQIDRLKEQYQAKLEEEHQKVLDDASEIYKYRMQNEIYQQKARMLGTAAAKHEGVLKKMQEDHDKTLSEKVTEHETILNETRAEHDMKVKELEDRILQLTEKLDAVDNDISEQNTNIMEQG